MDGEEQRKRTRYGDRRGTLSTPDGREGAIFGGFGVRVLGLKDDKGERGLRGVGMLGAVGLFFMDAGPPAWREGQRYLCRYVQVHGRDSLWGSQAGRPMAKRQISR
jgi:hypothetical protein